MIEAFGFFTTIVSLAGAIISYILHLRFKDLEDELAKRLYRLFLADSLFFFVTVLFGLATLLGIDVDIWLYPLRIFIIFANIYYGYKLVSPL